MKALLFRRPILMSLTLALSVLLLVLSGISCSREEDHRELTLPATPIIAVQGSWGVVASNYLRLRSDPAQTAEVLAGLTKGTVLKILSATEKEEEVEDETDYWYRVSLEGLEGWVFGAFLEIVESQVRALEIAEELK
jgi:SH3-like domain-containing protein